MKSTITELSYFEREELAARWRAADQIVRSILPGNALTRNLSDLRTLQAMVDHPMGYAAIATATEEFGVAFGELTLALETARVSGIPLKWCHVQDDYGGRFAIKHAQFDAWVNMSFAVENKFSQGDAFKLTS